MALLIFSLKNRAYFLLDLAVYSINRGTLINQWGDIAEELTKNTLMIDELITHDRFWRWFLPVFLWWFASRFWRWFLPVFSLQMQTSAEFSKEFKSVFSAEIFFFQKNWLKSFSLKASSRPPPSLCNIYKIWPIGHSLSYIVVYNYGVDVS